jgi:hypothetical protein
MKLRRETGYSIGVFSVCDHFLLYPQDVSLLLEDYMETDFNAILEDGSPDELGELLVTMWRQCGEGDFTIATNALAKEYMRHEGKMCSLYRLPLIVR